MSYSIGDSITIRVQLHSILRRPLDDEGLLRNQFELTLEPGSVVRDVLDSLHAPEMDIVFALNDDVVDDDTRLHDGDRLALIPAVEGGKC